MEHLIKQLHILKLQVQAYGTTILSNQQCPALPNYTTGLLINTTNLNYYSINIINTTGIQIDTSNLYDNASKSDLRKVEITNKLEDIITDSLIDEVKEYYRADIELIDRVKRSSK